MDRQTDRQTFGVIECPCRSLKICFLRIREGIILCIILPFHIHLSTISCVDFCHVLFSILPYPVQDSTISCATFCYINETKAIIIQFTKSAVHGEIIVNYVLGTPSIKKNGKKDDIVHLSNYPHPPGLKVTPERMTNHFN